MNTANRFLLGLSLLLLPLVAGAATNIALSSIPSAAGAAGNASILVNVPQGGTNAARLVQKTNFLQDTTFYGTAIFPGTAKAITAAIGTANVTNLYPRGNINQDENKTFFSGAYPVFAQNGGTTTFYGNSNARAVMNAAGILFYGALTGNGSGFTNIPLAGLQVPIKGNYYTTNADPGTPLTVDPAYFTTNDYQLSFAADAWRAATNQALPATQINEQSQILVSGAGSAAANGVYTYSAGDTAWLNGDSTAFIIFTENSVTLSSVDGTSYQYTGSAVTLEGSTWTVDFGDAPAPSVTWTNAVSGLSYSKILGGLTATKTVGSDTVVISNGVIISWGP